MHTIQIGDITMREATSKDIDAKIIFDAIGTHRNDLRVWLLFVDTLQIVEDEKAFWVSVCDTEVEVRHAPYMTLVDNQFAGLVLRKRGCTAYKYITPSRTTSVMQFHSDYSSYWKRPNVMVNNFFKEQFTDIHIYSILKHEVNTWQD